MLNNLHKELPEVEEAGGAALNRAMSAAKDGFESVRTRPFIWSTASLGLGALMGGLYALWSRPKRAAAKTMPARARPKQTRRANAKTKPNGIGSNAPKKRARKASRPRSSESASADV
jgi:hypothetical protein